MRTEDVDLPADFDRATNVEVRVRAIGVLSTWSLNSIAFRLYDAVLVGRRASESFDGCIDKATIDSVDPPGVGDVFDVPVVSSVENPSICLSSTLGDVTVTQWPDISYAPWGSLQQYTVEGEAASSNEAFFQSTSAVGPPRGTDDPFYTDLLNATDNAGVWTAEVPGLLVDARRPMTMIYTIGDPPSGWTTGVRFPLTLDRRVRIVPVTVWRLIRDSDGAGTNVTAGLVSSWFGWNPTEVTATDWNGAFWGRELEQFSGEGQRVDTIYAQCDVEDRIQFRLNNYLEWPVPDWYVDRFDTNDLGNLCDRRLANLQDLQGLPDLAVVPGTINVYLVRSWGQVGGGACGNHDDALIVGQSWDEGIVIAEDRVAGRINVLAHELWHFMTDRGHCFDGTFGPCVQHDLMGGNDPGDPEATITEQECRFLTGSHAQNVP
jgi:uncharacterized protein YndB with AHSA1/START domain